jgi:deazaflavin-dependent oxidoreductase (nitroreductase family)
MTEIESLSQESFCYLTTRGRVTGNPREIEIWFVARDSTIYMLSGGGGASDWVKNLKADAHVSVRIAGSEFDGMARLVDDPQEDAWVRAALLARYNPDYSSDLTGWSQSALPVAVDLAV